MLKSFRHYFFQISGHQTRTLLFSIFELLTCLDIFGLHIRALYYHKLRAAETSVFFYVLFLFFLLFSFLFVSFFIYLFLFFVALFLFQDITALPFYLFST